MARSAWLSVFYFGTSSLSLPSENIVGDFALGWDVTSDAFFKCCVAIFLAFICMLCLVYSAVDICILLPLPRWLGALIGTPPRC